MGTPYGEIQMSEKNKAILLEANAAIAFWTLTLQMM